MFSLRPVLCGFALFLSSSALVVAQAKPTYSTVPKGAKKSAPQATAISVYNQGVTMLLRSDYAKAQGYFERAIKMDAKLAQAHNNLCFVLRKQNTANFDLALKHCNRALEIKPKMPEAYMARGILHVQMKNVELAKKDFNKLSELDKKLGQELEWVILKGKEKSGSNLGSSSAL